jgi:hypothetical protein
MKKLSKLFAMLMVLLMALLFNPLFADEPLISTQTYTVGEYYKWGTIIGINTNGILLNTVEGKKIFDFETQKVRQVNINNDIYIVEDELKILTKQKGYEYLNALFDYMFALDEQECNEILNKWEKYKVQIASFNKNGKEYIYFNFLGGGILTKKFLESGLIQVCDGGNAFWSICYNLKEKKFYNLSINGEA